MEDSTDKASQHENVFWMFRQGSINSECEGASIQCRVTLNMAIKIIFPILVMESNSH